MTANDKERPYKPSWIDRFNGWVAELPTAGWAFCVGLGLVLVLIQVLFLWLDGGLAVAEVLLPLIIFNGLSVTFLPGLVHVLGDQAVTAELHETRARDD